jgi:16S rRNA (cytosine1402-N4)-methyltransferase
VALLPKHSENLASSRSFQGENTHIPVLLEETIDLLDLHAGDNAVDCTVGGGGHAAAMLEKTAPQGTLIGIDADPETLEIARHLLKPFGQRVHLIHDNFINTGSILNERFPDLPIRAVLLDLGLSSLALRGADSRFSFLSSGPLDFRFDPSADIPTAADLLNRRTRSEIETIIHTYGEEPAAKRIATAIVQRRSQRPFNLIPELRELIEAVIPRRSQQRLHPATRTFQALRIAVNDELGVLERALPDLLERLIPGGRIAVLSYHSLEDRIVKQYFRKESRDCLCPPEQPICTCGHRARLRIITKHTIQPSPTEISRNPRSRSAKLRVVEKIT